MRMRTFRSAAAELPDILRRCPGLGEAQHEGLHPRRIIGHSNIVFDVQVAGQRLACRFSRLPTSPDRALSDRLATASAYHLGLGAEPLLSDAPGGFTVTRWIDGAEPCSGVDFRAKQRLRRDAFAMLGRFHAGSGDLPVTTDPEAAIAGLIVSGHECWRGLAAFDHVASVLAATQPLLAAAGPLVPSHGDPSPQNFLKVGRRLHLIDWEYAAMAPALWDFGYFSFEAGLLPDEAAALLAEVGVTPRPDMRALAAAMLHAGVLNALWLARSRRKSVAAANEARWLRVLDLARRLSGSM